MPSFVPVDFDEIREAALRAAEGDRLIEDAAPILRAILDVPADRRMDAVAMALRAAIDTGALDLGRPWERTAG